MKYIDLKTGMHTIEEHEAIVEELLKEGYIYMLVTLSATRSFTIHPTKTRKIFAYYRELSLKTDTLQCEYRRVKNEVSSKHYRL